MGDKDPRLSERLNRFYEHIEGEMPPASLEHFDSDAAGRHQRVVHVWAGIAGVAAVAAAVGALVVGLNSHRTSTPLPAPATSHSPSLPTGVASPTAVASPSASAFANFQPAAFSAISESQYWVIGYNGTACAPCNPILLHTVDGGSTFQQIPAPPVPFKGAGPQTVAGIRFADASDGYAFGSVLWVTHDSGAHWHQVSLGGSVPQLEPGAGGFVYAVVHQCPPGGNACNDNVVRSVAGGDTWTILPGVDEHGAIGVHGTSLWVMQFGSGKLYVSRDAGSSFAAITFPCAPGLAGSLDPVSDSVLWAFCATGTQGGPLVSTDGGHSWSSQRGGFSNGGVVAGTSADTAFVSDASSALRVSHDRGASYSTILNWHPTSSWWVGFTDAAVGYTIVPGPNASDMQLWRTTDGGAHWAQVRFAS